MATLATEYTIIDRTRENGMVTIQETTMFFITLKSTLSNPLLKELESTHPLATPAPTIPIT
mgnify:CR=1 FL=1